MGVTVESFFDLLCNMKDSVTKLLINVGFTVVVKFLSINLYFV